MRYIYLIIALFAVAPLCAAGDVGVEFERKLSSASSANRTIVAKFSQHKKVVGLKDEVRTGGDFYYDNRGNMAMIYESPEGDKVVMNGDSFTIVVGGKRIESSSENPMMAQISYMMQASMSGDVGKLGRGWELSIDHSESQYRVVVVPIDRRVKRYITSMTMIFDDQSLTLDTLRIDEKSGGFTAYNFFSKQINQDIDSKIFKP